MRIKKGQIATSSHYANRYYKAHPPPAFINKEPSSSWVELLQRNSSELVMQNAHQEPDDRQEYS